MERKRIIQEMRTMFGTGVITRKNLAKYFGTTEKTVERYLAGLEAVDGKYYFIQDVADSLLERMEMK